MGLSCRFGYQVRDVSSADGLVAVASSPGSSGREDGCERRAADIGVKLRLLRATAWGWWTTIDSATVDRHGVSRGHSLHKSVGN